MDGRRYQRALEAPQGLWNRCSRSTNTLHVVKLSEIFSKAKTKVFRVRTIIWLTFQNLVTTKYDLFVICFHFRYMKNNNLHASWAAFRLKMFHSQKLKGCLTSMPKGCYLSWNWNGKVKHLAFEKCNFLPDITCNIFQFQKLLCSINLLRSESYSH